MLKTARLTFITEQKFSKRDAEKLRGYFGSLYREEDLFHNHSGENRVIYRFPFIQYKVIDRHLNIFGINQAVPLVAEKFLRVKELRIGNNVINHFETQLSIMEQEFYVDDNLYSYRFYTPWLPVNQKNYLKYINKKLDLNRVLQNNILTNFKGLGITIDKKIMAKGDFKEKSIFVNDIEYFGFTGSFTTNAVMPDYMSLGKNRSIGFGCVVRRKEK